MSRTSRAETRSRQTQGEQFWRRSITFGDYCGLSESTRGSGKALGTLPHHTAWNGHKHRTVRIWLGRMSCDDFYGVRGGRRTVVRPGRLDYARKTSHLVLLLDHVEGFGGCRALVAPRTLPSATQARTGEVSSLTARTGKVRVRSNRRSTRQMTLDRARRSLV